MEKSEYDGILSLVKNKEGIKSDRRDDYINNLIPSAIEELKNVKGIDIDLSNPSHVVFVADWTYYQYVNKDKAEMPRYLKQKLHDFQITYRRNKGQ